MNAKEAAEAVEASPEFERAHTVTAGKIVAIFDTKDKTAGYQVTWTRKPREQHTFAIDDPGFHFNVARYLETTAKIYGQPEPTKPPRGVSAQDYLSTKADRDAAALGIIIAAAELPLQLDVIQPVNDRAPRTYALTNTDRRRLFSGSFADALIYLGREIAKAR